MSVTGWCLYSLYFTIEAGDVIRMSVADRVLMPLLIASSCFLFGLGFLAGGWSRSVREKESRIVTLLVFVAWLIVLSATWYYFGFYE